MRRVVLLTLVLLVALPGTASAVTPERIERVIDASLSGLLARQLEWGGFDDPLAGPRFGYGAIALGWLAGGEAGARSLRAGTRMADPGGFQAWIEALR